MYADRLADHCMHRKASANTVPFGAWGTGVSKGTETRIGVVKPATGSLSAEEESDSVRPISADSGARALTCGANWKSSSATSAEVLPASERSL